MPSSPAYSTPSLTQIQLWIAANDGDLVGATRAVQAGALPGVKGKEDITPLGLAVLGGNLEMVKLFLDRLKSLDLCSDAHVLPLHAAAAPANAKEIFEALLDAGADLQAKSGTAGGVLNIAVRHQSPELVEWLIAQGAPTEVRSSAANTPLLEVVHTEMAPEAMVAMLDVLIRGGARTDAHNRHGETVLMHAATDGQARVFMWLAEQGGDLRQRTTFGGSMAHHVCGLTLGDTPEERQADMDARVAILTRLMAGGVDLEDQDNLQRSTALHAAAREGALPLMELLHANGAKLEARAQSDATPLHWAAQSATPAAALWLLGRGADPDARDREGKLPEDVSAHQETRAAFRHWRHTKGLEQGVPQASKRAPGRL